MRADPVLPAAALGAWLEGIPFRHVELGTSRYHSPSRPQPLVNTTHSAHWRFPPSFDRDGFLFSCFCPLQVGVTVLEAQKLVGVNINPYVAVRVGEQRRVTATQRGTNCPFYNEVPATKEEWGLRGTQDLPGWRRGRGLGGIQPVPLVKRGSVKEGVPRGARTGGRAFSLQEAGARGHEPFTYTFPHLSCYPTST